MGKNQAYEAMQRARLGFTSAGSEDIDDGMEDALKKGELEADTDRMMREYRAQLDAERAQKLVRGRNHSRSKSGHKKIEKTKDSKKHRSKKRKRSRRRSSDSSSSSSSSESSCDEEERESRRRSKSKRDKKKKLKSKKQELKQ